MMQSTAWLALAHQGPCPEMAGAGAVRTGTLTVALRGLPRVARVLAEARILSEGRVSSAALIAGQDVGVVMRLRGPGGDLLRHGLVADLHDHPGAAELSFSWIGGGDLAPSGRWRLSLLRPDGQDLVPPAWGSGALAPGSALGQALVAGCEASPFIAAAGLRRAAPGRIGPEQVGRMAAVAARAFVKTPQGLVPAATLMAGDAVIDVSGRALRLAAVHLAEVPEGFAFSPVTLASDSARGLEFGPFARLAQPEGWDTAGALAAQSPHAPPAQARVRGHLMAVAVPERPAILEIGGRWLACADPEGRLPQPVAALSPCARAV